MSEEKNKPDGKTKRKGKSDFEKVIESARELFEKQHAKSTDMKRMCLQVTIARFYNDAPRFAEHFRIAVNDFLDSERFKKQCTDVKLEPKTVAEHLLMEKQSVRTEVMKKGFAVLDGRERFWISPLITKDFYAPGVEENKDQQ